MNGPEDDNALFYAWCQSNGVSRDGFIDTGFELAEAIRIEGLIGVIRYSQRAVAASFLH
jgi:hypothetical protein